MKIAQQINMQTNNDLSHQCKLFCASGLFSMKSFCNEIDMIRANNSQGTPANALVWKCLAPPRVEILAWFVLQGRLNTKQRLAGLNHHPHYISFMPFMFTCQWNCWGYFLWVHGVMENLGWLSSAVEYRLVCPNNPVSFFQAWCGVRLYGLEKKMWISLFYVIVWSLW